MPNNPLKTKWQAKFLGLEVHHPDLQAAGDEIEFFCNRWVRGDTQQSCLTIVGQPGCGKTHLLRRIERFARGAQVLAHQKRSETVGYVVTKIPPILYWFWPVLADEFKRDQDWPKAEGMDADLLLWDDLGAENDPWKKCIDAACQIMSRREKKFTVITTNVVPDQWAERFDQRMADRFLRNSIIVDLLAVPSWATAK